MLEVYLKYPDELNELHNDYPLTPEKLEISHDILSKYCCNIANKYDIKIDDVNELVPNLCNKSKYAPYYKNLQLYFSLGMEFTKFHIIPKFQQSYWLKKYINSNTEKRKNAINRFEKDFVKVIKS